MLTGKSLIAASVGGVSGVFLFYLLASTNIALVSVPVGGVLAVTCFRWVLRQRVNLVEGVVLGFLSGVVFSVLVAVMTVIQTGAGTLEFAAAVTFLPVIFCILSTVGGLVAAFFFSDS